MSYNVIRFECGNDEMFVRCNLSEASSPVEWCPDTEGEWQGTQWQCADCRHSISGLMDVGLDIARDAWQIEDDEDDPEGEVIDPFNDYANTDHEDAREWFACYGWHLPTENAGCVGLQSVEIDWLELEPEEIADKLMEADPDLMQDEADAIAEQALEVWQVARGVESLLHDAVEAYEQSDLEACIRALDACEELETDHGSSPASDSLRSELLKEEYLKLFK